ncbi:YgdI/YgdR family lipoprotein [Budvicia diplopodorum]|uniref:YgdI/YgdR family lipoprotein n=1 Tax=Budvicia diplopodorum TaxID=1119056 RepID=UPI001FE3A63F|nr:YgdI/YgdR family lipoprotein [Budvicia diplopodorum]
MMKKLAILTAALAMVSVLSACSSGYVITTKSGEMLISKDKPVMDEETGMISYTDKAGDQHQVKSEDIQEMMEK